MSQLQNDRQQRVNEMTGLSFHKGSCTCGEHADWCDIPCDVEVLQRVNRGSKKARASEALLFHSLCQQRLFSFHFSCSLRRRVYNQNRCGHCTYECTCKNRSKCMPRHTLLCLRPFCAERTKQKELSKTDFFKQEKEGSPLFSSAIDQCI